MADEQRHELVILLGIHPLLDVHEAFGKPYGAVAHIVWSVCLLAALRGVDEIQERAQFCMTAIGQLPEAAVSHRAVVMQTERIARWYVLVYLCCLPHCLLHIISFLRIRGAMTLFILDNPFLKLSL